MPDMPGGVIVTDHRCDRPNPGASAEPWRCHECGLLWEPLPTSPVTQFRQRLKGSRFRLLSLIGQCVALLALGWVVQSPRFMLIMCVVCALDVAFWHWQERREKRRLPLQHDEQGDLVEER